MNSYQQTHDATDRDEPRTNAAGRDTTEAHAHPQPIVTLPIQDPTETIRAPEPTYPPHTNANEPSRPNAVERVQTRHDPTRRDESRTDAPHNETADLQQSHDHQQVYAEPSDINWLDVEQTAQLLSNKGISRTIRTIQKMCKRGDLIAKLVPTEHGVRYIISDQSVDAFIERHNEKLPSGSLNSEHELEADGPTIPRSIQPQTDAKEHIETIPSSSPDASEPHLREIIGLKDQQIAMMQSQIDTANAQLAVKDEQIATMHERDHETNVLIQNLQRLVALPEARTNQTSSNDYTDLDR